LTQKHPSILAYAKPPQHKFNALSSTGLAIALLSLVIPGLMAFTLWRNRGQAVSQQIGVIPGYYALPLASIVRSTSPATNPNASPAATPGSSSS
jgi:hypothetical protein